MTDAEKKAKKKAAKKAAAANKQDDKKGETSPRRTFSLRLVALLMQGPQSTAQ